MGKIFKGFGEFTENVVNISDIKKHFPVETVELEDVFKTQECDNLTLSSIKDSLDTLEVPSHLEHFFEIDSTATSSPNKDPKVRLRKHASLIRFQHPVKYCPQGDPQGDPQDTKTKRTSECTHPWLNMLFLGEEIDLAMPVNNPDNWFKTVEKQE